MCDFSKTLIAWQDGELPDQEAAAVAQHVRICEECRQRLDAYRKVGGMVNAYCDAALASQARAGRLRSWAPVLGAAATVAVLLMLFTHIRAERSLPDSPAAAAASAAPSVASAPDAPKILPAPLSESLNRSVSTNVRRHSPVARARVQDAQLGAQRQASWPPAEPAIQIAIPGEAIFPPGALPPGIDFVAEVSIAADGSAQRLRLQPQLAAFEGGSNHQ